MSKLYSKLRIGQMLEHLVLLMLASNCCIVFGSALETEILTNYEPLAMDESVTFIDGPGSNSIRSTDKNLDTRYHNKVEDEEEFSDILRDRENVDEFDLDPFPSSFDNIVDPIQQSEKKTFQKRPSIVDVENSTGKKVSSTIFSMPKIETPKLTKLITGKESATFLEEKIIKPEINNTGKSKVLASYNLMIPIWIPPIKAPKVKINDRLLQKDIKYTQETKTEMVPMQKEIPSVVTVLKAERVPQKIVTDFVKTDNLLIPSKVDDRLGPHDKLVKTVVTNYS